MKNCEELADTLLRCPAKMYPDYGGLNMDHSLVPWMQHCFSQTDWEIRAAEHQI